MYINEGTTAVVVDVASLNVRLLIVSLLLNTHSHTSGLGIQSSSSSITSESMEDFSTSTVVLSKAKPIIKLTLQELKLIVNLNPIIIWSKLLSGKPLGNWLLYRRVYSWASILGFP